MLLLAGAFRQENALFTVAFDANLRIADFAEPVVLGHDLDEDFERIQSSARGRYLN